jgi:uncharacterized membrane protein
MKGDNLTYYGLKYTLIGTVLLIGGIAFLAAEVSNQGFLWGALYSGIWGIIAPFVLIFLGAALIYLGISVKEKNHKPKKSRIGL